jgi:hypothetical protein
MPIDTTDLIWEDEVVDDGPQDIVIDIPEEVTLGATTAPSYYWGTKPKRKKTKEELREEKIYEDAEI